MLNSRTTSTKSGVPWIWSSSLRATALTLGLASRSRPLSRLRASRFTARRPGSTGSAANPAVWVVRPTSSNAEVRDRIRADTAQLFGGEEFDQSCFFFRTTDEIERTE